MEKQKIYLEISEEIYRELRKNRIDLEQVLKQQNIGGEIMQEPSPFSSSGTAKTMGIELAIEVSRDSKKIKFTCDGILDGINKILQTCLNKQVGYDVEKSMTDPKTGEVLEENGKIKTTKVKSYEPAVKREKSPMKMGLLRAKFFIRGGHPIKSKNDGKK